MEAVEAARLLFARPWAFLTGAPSLEALPPAYPTEIAFAGRSNVGKSSLINALVGMSGLARTSNTPGRTQALNFFGPQGRDDLALVDMPGYGYASAPKAEVRAWTRLVFDYLRGRPTLRRVYVLIDARHGAKPNDAAAFDLLDRAAVSYQAVLTKADKLAKEPDAAPVREMAARVAEALRRRPAAHPEVLVTSAEKGWGIAALRAEVAALAESMQRSRSERELEA